MRRPMNTPLRPRPPSPPGLPRAPVLGSEVTVCSFVQAQDHLAARVAAGAPGYFSCANAYSTTLAQDDAALHRVLQGAAVLTADGMPVVWALRALGHGQAERVHNDDLFLACCARFTHWRHFLVGGRVGQCEEVAAEMRRRFPGIVIVGMHATPVRPLPAADMAAILAQMGQARPSIVWVGMGTPAQDHFMADVEAAAGVPLVGVGSLFDLLSGRTQPVPAWAKRAGLQWVFRLVQEPRRLARRYLVHNTRFVAGVCKQWWHTKTKERHEPG
jgi:N-acetylglucosaminyldiphosphoundecaprenol N-acetyl-beta-D-mannosaminyltransferase